MTPSAKIPSGSDQCATPGLRGVALFVYTISRAPDVGWGSARTILLLIASGALLVGFLVNERRVPENVPCQPAGKSSLRIFLDNTVITGLYSLLRDGSRHLVFLSPFPSFASQTLLLQPGSNDRNAVRRLSDKSVQLLAIGRALMSKPNFVLFDEPSLGLAPLIVEAVLEAIDRIRRELGIGGVLVEQNVDVALDLCASLALLSLGRIVAYGRAADVTADPQFVSALFGDDAARGNDDEVADYAVDNERVQR